MNTPYTPGPLFGKGIRILTASGKKIGEAWQSIPSDRSLPKTDEACANAKLWAAAPELAEALQAVLGMLELLNAPGTNDPIEARVFQAKAALRKAGLLPATEA